MSSGFSIRIFSLIVAGVGLLAVPVFAQTEPFCGNAVLEFGEECDDGNLADGDCCSSVCTFEAAASSCADGDVCNGDETCNGTGTCVAGTAPVCDDGELCSQDSCDAVTGCTYDWTPVLSCNESSGKAVLKLWADDDKPSRNSARFKWLRGDADVADYGDPENTTDYALCIYDAGGLVTSSAVPAGAECDDAACWAPNTFGNGTQGFVFEDRNKSNDGVRKFTAKEGAGNARLRLRARGEALPIAEMGAGLSAPVTAQVVTSDADCWSATFDSSDLLHNDGTQLDARSSGAPARR